MIVMTCSRQCAAVTLSVGLVLAYQAHLVRGDFSIKENVTHPPTQFCLSLAALGTPRESGPHCTSHFCYLACFCFDSLTSSWNCCHTGFHLRCGTRPAVLTAQHPPASLHHMRQVVCLCVPACVCAFVQQACCLHNVKSASKG